MKPGDEPEVDMGDAPARPQPAPCRCALCLALLKLAESAERNYQAAVADKKLTPVRSKPGSARGRARSP